MQPWDRLWGFLDGVRQFSAAVFEGLHLVFDRGTGPDIRFLNLEFALEMVSPLSFFRYYLGTTFSNVASSVAVGT